MEKEQHKKWGFLLLFLFLFLSFAFLLWYFSQHQDKTGTNTDPNSFSPFNRNIKQPVRAPSTDIPYQEPARASTTEPRTSTPSSQTTPTQENVSTEPSYRITPSSSFYQREPGERETFNIPSQQRTSEPVVYSEPSGGTQGGSPTYMNNYGYSYAQESYQTGTQRQGSEAKKPKVSAVDQFAAMDKEVFGYVSGLGWTELLGGVGQQVFDMIYSLTPQGTTHATLGTLLGGTGGAAGMMGGGFGGGGGGGAVMNFGGMVNQITQCTCNASVMLDILDVRSQQISLIVQYGLTQIYSNYNINGIGQNVLGNYVSGGTCLVYHGEDCSSEGSPVGTITMIGTSAF